MSDESVVKKCEDIHSDTTNKINDMLIQFQDESRSVQAKDAFWYAFEYARCRPDKMSIQSAWEEYKENRSCINN